jgi:Spy/CpxP family protein refolding chaperone
MAVVAASLVMGVASAWAGSSCCPAKKSAKAGEVAKGGKDWAQCEKMVSSMDLSEDQKAKISSIQEACKKEGNTEESCGKYMGQIRDVLTPEQQTKWDEGLKSCE